MQTAAFLRKLLPEHGYKAIMTIFDKGGQSYRRHIYDKDTDKLAGHALTCDAEYRQPVYFALASFKEAKQKGGRTHDNALAAKSFWFDIDCGEEKAAKGSGYISQREALEHLIKFIRAVKLPPPMVVSSGNGLHVYWPLTVEIPAQAWVQIATLLKAAAQHCNFKADPSRTADIASVLRPVGTFNRKGGVDRQVVLLKDAEPVSMMQFATPLATYIKANKISVKQQARRVAGANAALLGNMGQIEFPASDAIEVASKCAQIGALKESGGNIEEPLWYAGLGVVSKCTDGEVHAHAWSSGHPQYSKDETDKKLAQLEKVGPTTCARFESLNPALCSSCKFKDKIASPIQLGYATQQLSAPSVVMAAPQQISRKTLPPIDTNLPPPPHPYRRTEKGLFIVIEDVPKLFFDRDLYPVQIVYDESMHCEMVRIRYDKPNHGLIEFHVKLSALAEPKELTRAMFDNGVITTTVESRGYMTGYITHYVKEIQRKAATVQMYDSMGWKEDGSTFIIGSSMIDSQGQEINIGLSSKLKNVKPAAFMPNGDMKEWIELTKLINVPGMEAHRFVLCAGFGALLFRFTRLEAVAISMLGKTGSCKSTMQKMVASIFGDYHYLMLQKNDTDNAKFKRIGMYCHLPVVLEETTNVDANVLAEFVLHITQGRERLRLNADATENSAQAFWNTIVLMSSNESMISRLGQAKANSEAEAMRLFEIQVPQVEGMDKWMDDHFPRVLDNSYGHVGRIYIKALLRLGPERLYAEVKKMREMVSMKFTMRGQERYWTGAIVCALLGGKIARALKLIEFDPMELVPWIYGTVSSLRAAVTENTLDATDLLTEFLLRSLDSTLIINQSSTNAARGVSTMIRREPTRQLLIRVEEHSKTIFITKSSFIEFLREKKADFNVVKEDLKTSKILIDHDRKASLHKGTGLSAGQTRCLVLDLNNPIMSHTLMKVIDNTEDKAATNES